jgi:hypothetical protein
MPLIWCVYARKYDGGVRRLGGAGGNHGQTYVIIITGTTRKLSALDLGATRGRLAVLETPSRHLIQPGRVFIRVAHPPDLPAVP